MADFLHGTLLSGLDGRGLWLKLFLHDSLPPSVRILRSGHCYVNNRENILFHLCKCFFFYLNKLNIYALNQRFFGQSSTLLYQKQIMFIFYCGIHNFMVRKAVKETDLNSDCPCSIFYSCVLVCVVFTLLHCV